MEIERSVLANGVLYLSLHGRIETRDTTRLANLVIDQVRGEERRLLILDLRDCQCGKYNHWFGFLLGELRRRNAMLRLVLDENQITDFPTEGFQVFPEPYLAISSLIRWAKDNGY
jgi:hypothetical protein